MRRVDAEGDSRGVRGQQQAESRSRSKLRRAAIEWLERRELLSTSTSTLPSPTVLSAPNLTPFQQVQDLSLATAGQALTPNQQASSPSVSVDPLNPLRMVATWDVHSQTGGYQPGGFNVPVTSYIEGAFSTDGGLHWSPITSAAFGAGGNLFSRAAGGLYSVNVQLDPSIAPSPGVVDVLSQTTDPTIGYDRSGNFYILSSTHNDANTVGVLDLQRFSWGSGAGSPSYNGITQVYTWDTPDGGTSADQALTPVLAVDANLPMFTDPATGATVTDQFSGNMYAVWAEVDSNTNPGPIPGFNPNTIRMAASSDQGQHFTHAAYVDNSSNANGHNTALQGNPPPPNILHASLARYSEPSVTISQGSATVPGGQVTIVYDDHGTIAPLDRILAQNNQAGGTSVQAIYSNPNGADPAGIIPINSLAGVSIPITVTLPANFTLQALDVTLQIQFPNSANIGATLMPPAGSGLAPIRLFNGDIGVNASGTPDSTANLGYTANSTAAPGTAPGTLSGTVFDSEAVRTIRDGTAASHAVGHYQPDGEGALLSLQGLSGTVLSGMWHLVVNVNTADTSTTNVDYVGGVTLNFSQGNNPGAAAGLAGAEKVIADKNSLYEVPIPNINPANPSSAYGDVFHTANPASPLFDGLAGTGVSGSGTYTAPTQAAAILPLPVIASDNTLGSFSPHAGRIYVAFTGSFYNTTTNAQASQAGDTDIFLSYSDDGGATWSTLQQVNDDNAATDGFSGASDNATGAAGITGRAQYMPSIAVDQSTGDVVVSFLDARHDPSNARVDTEVAVSANGATINSDGTSGFAADVYANRSLTATDAVTGGAVNLGPIPDNQSAAGGIQTTFGYGTRQALAVVNGRIVPIWTADENQNVAMQIVSSVLSLTAGPRIISSTQGPVGLSGDTTNTSKDSSGTTLANTIIVTFDRTIDPTAYASLQADVSVFYESPAGGAKIPLPVTTVTPLNGSGNQGATRFAIKFNPASLSGTAYGFVGTYSYAIAPTGIIDQIRQGVSGARGTVMDQNANGTPGQVTGDDYVVGQPTGFTTYASGTLPLIVPGPHISSVTPIDPTTNASIVSSGSTNNLVLNNTVSALLVTFDRNINVNSFNLAQILGIFGPAGVVSLAGLTITPLQVYTSTGQVMYANGGFANVFKISFATQQISGTYTISIGTGIVASDSSAGTTQAGVDANTNAGLDALRGTATNGVTVPVTYNSAASAQAPVAIQPATVNTDGSITPSSLSVPIVVPDNFPIQGDNPATGVSGITLTLSITYPTDPDLTAYLLAPDGVTRVNLFTKVGAGTNTANFSTTTLSDTASTSIDKAGAPFFGTFLPESPFANLTGTGLTSLGTWTLVIQNAGSSSGAVTSYSLTFRKPISATGLAEFPNDQSSASFQIFNLAATNALANSTWTAVGPAGITPSSGKGTLAGTIASMAVDPSDTTGNTVYVGTAAGGVWKTTNFLTPAATGPVWVPLTDFGPNFAQNIGSIAVFGRNNDPNQSILFVGTGFGQERVNATNGSPNADGSTGLGAGMLRSMDGGKTWQVVGNFAGQSTYKIVVDPTPNINDQAVVYAAMSGGFYRSLDSGNTWTLLGAGNATDVILDPNSKSPTTGNLDTLYVAFSNPTGLTPNQSFPEPVGIYVSSNQGQTLQPVNGQLGKDPLLVTPGFPAQPLPVANAGVTPNNANSAYIVLGKPALTGNTAENLAYESWLYAAVENYNGTFQGLYVTKDNGQNWTLVQLPNIPGGGSVKAAVPTNATTATNSYDPTSSHFTSQGGFDLTLTVDPTNPNIVYIGGSQDFQGSGMIRVDLTNLYDAHNLTSGSNDRSDGGSLFINGQGGVNAAAGTIAQYPVGTPTQILNLRYAPNNGTPGTSPFNINATLVINNAAAGFVNDGTGATWSLFDEPLKANAGDQSGSSNLHNVIDYVDPITGNVRFMFADDEGIFTALVKPDGTLSTGIGTDVEPNYSRNGNLQNEELNTSAAQPSAASAAQAGAEFYASGKTTIAAQSDQNVLTDGNLTWDNSAVLSPGQTSPRNTTASNSIVSSDRSGVGIATDQTGGVSTGNPAGSPSVYEFDVPILGGNLTDFFRVNQFGQTTGLDNNINQEFPAAGYNGDAHQGGVAVVPVTNVPPSPISGAIVNGQIPIGNFEVNPLNGSQIIIASATGNLYETTNQGILWQPIGNAANFGANAAIIDAVDGGQFTGKPGRTTPLPIQISAMAYGAPDPNVIGGVGNLNNFIYVGTTGNNYNNPDAGTAGDTYRDANGLLYNDAHIYVTQAGGAGWLDVSKGLDGSSVVGIYPAPDRGSHAAYAITLTGIFYSPDTVGLANSGQTVWTNITSNLKSLTYDAFNNAAYQQAALAGYAYVPPNLIIPPPNGTPNLAPPQPYNPVYNSQYGGFTDIVADYRYEIPAPTNATQGTNIFYPVLYASGYGGVFRSVDNGATWTVFPSENFDNAPVDGGYLPHVEVTNLQLVLGNINPDTGHPTQATGDPEVLLATTYGRGDFAIRLAPYVIPTTVAFDTSLPAPDGSDSSGVGITNVKEPYLDGVSEVSNFGNVVTIKIFDETGGPGQGTLLGTGTTNALGQFTVQIVDSGQDPSFFTSSTAFNDKVVGIQATDSSGASGNLTLFRYTLDLINPNTPNAPVLEATYDTGRSTTDGLTNLSVPAQAGPGAPLTIVTPTFDVTTSLPQANPLSPNPISLTVELLRGDSPTGPFFVIDQTQTGFINAGNTAETYMLTDPGLAAMAATGINQTFYYEALQIDEAGNVSQPASNVETVVVNTIAPAAPTGITLVSLGTTSPPMPTFSVTGVLPNNQVLLYRSINNGAPILVGSGAVNTSGATATLQVTDTTGASPDGVYTYYAAQLDVYGNFSLLTAGLQEIINTQTPPAAPILESAYDTGRSNSDRVTDIEVPAPTPGSAPVYVSPVFDVNTVPPATGQPPITTVELFRSTSASGPFTTVVGTAAFTGNPAMITDGTLAALVATGQINQKFYYAADQINAAGIHSALSPVLTITVDTVIPPTLPAETLDPNSNTGLNKSQLITNVTKPTFDATNLAPGDQLFLYRSTGGKAPVLVGTGPINNTNAAIAATVQDTVGAVPDGVYQYFVVEQDLAGNISNYSQAVTVTIDTTAPPKPTIALLTSDDTGLPSHPNVTSVNTPHFVGNSQFNAGTNFPVAIVNVATGAVLGTTFPAANGTYLAQITSALPDGVYTLEARTTNLAGTNSFSAPLTVTILHTGPQIPPNLTLLPADDTGIKGDGVTSNHDPRFTGTTDKGDVVSLYLLTNGSLQGPYATTTSSTINGSFTFQLPFNLTNGTTQLVARTSDIANNQGPFSNPYAVRISTTLGDYLGTGVASLTLFDPYNETYYVRISPTLTVPVQVDVTPGRDYPLQLDYNGDGVTDLSAFRFNTAEFYGFVSNNSGIDLQYGVGNASLPVSGYYGSSGTLITGVYIPSSGTWALALPQPGGLVFQFGVPKVDVPVPAAYNGLGSTEMAVFRNTPILGGDADSFSVIGPQGLYSVSFTSPAVQKLGFVYQAGDIAAPADYDGVGRDEFAIYRPSTGQFFILNTPNVANPATWTLRTVTMNLPGGPKAGDVPVSQDYDGTGKADPTVYRPGNSTFYIVHTNGQPQSNVQFQPLGPPTAANQYVAAGGPALYRLNALFGQFASTAGYYGVILSTSGGGGGASTALAITTGGGGTVHAASIASASASTAPAAAAPSASSPLSTMMVVATPIPVTSTPAPAPAPAATPAAPAVSVSVGTTTPKPLATTVATKATASGHATAKKSSKPLVVEAPAHSTKGLAAKAKANPAPAHATAKAHATASAKAASKSHATAGALAAASLQHLVMATKGRKKG